MKYYRITMTMDYEAEDEEDAARQATGECDDTMQIIGITELPDWPWHYTKQGETNEKNENP